MENNLKIATEADVSYILDLIDEIRYDMEKEHRDG